MSWNNDSWVRIEENVQSNNFLLNLKSIRDNIFSQDKRGKYMSIGAIFKCNDGILLLSDSKSTLNYKIEKGRENINKIFETDNFFIIHTGSNRINGTPIENFFSDFLKNNESLQEMMERFLKELKKDESFTDMNFIGFDKKTNNILIYSYIDKNPKKIINEAPFIAIGNEYYIDIINEFILYKEKIKINIDFQNIWLNISVDELQKLLNTELIKVIQHLDKLEYNNPVGLPLKFHIFKY